MIRLALRRLSPFTLALLVLGSTVLRAETCQTSTEMDNATRSALSSAGLRYFAMVAQADIAGLRKDAISGLASDFSGIEATVKDHQPDLAESKPAIRPLFLLDASGAGPIPHAEFFCGVFGKSGQTSGSAVFSLNNLPPGKYGIAILDASSPKAPVTATFVLQEVGNDWKLGGLYIKATQISGHDSDWFTSRGREYKAKGQLHNAWLFYSRPAVWLRRCRL